MRERRHFRVVETLPTSEQVLARNGVPDLSMATVAHRGMVERALELYGELARPAGIFEDIECGEFAELYLGEGGNERPNPLENIYPRADALALFALTLGPAISKKIDQLFAGSDWGLGYVLDSVASLGAERCADRLQLEWEGGLPQDGRPRRVLRYSPGYCGWNLSGQRKLFSRLKPSEVGIDLGESLLMQPLKSISGVIVGGTPTIHEFEPGYAFCRRCRHRSCRERLSRSRPHGLSY